MFDIDYDALLGCYTLHYAGEVICLGAETLSDARQEAEGIVAQWA